MKKRLLKIIKVGLIFVLVLFIILLTVIFVSERDRTVVEKYVKNENLPTVKADWKGTPVDESGRYVNAEFPFLPKILELLKWKLGSKPQKEEKQNDEWRVEVKDPG